MTAFQIGDMIKVQGRGYVTVNAISGDKLQCLTSAGNLIVVSAKNAIFFKKTNFKGLCNGTR